MPSHEAAACSERHSSPRRLSNAHGQPLPTSARFETAAETLNAFYSSCLQPPKLRQAQLNRPQLGRISEETPARQRAASWRQQPDEELRREASGGRHGRATGLLCLACCDSAQAGVPGWHQVAKHVLCLPLEIHISQPPFFGAAASKRPRPVSHTPAAGEQKDVLLFSLFQLYTSHPPERKTASFSPKQQHSINTIPVIFTAIHREPSSSRERPQHRALCPAVTWHWGFLQAHGENHNTSHREGFLATAKTYEMRSPSDKEGCRNRARSPAA